MRRVAILQARMTSTRLPGKVLMGLGGGPLIGRLVERLEASVLLDAIVVATTTNAADDPLAAFARARGLECFRGSEHDVLARYVGAARQSRADVIVRITADCPLIDAAVVDQVVGALDTASEPCDYAANVLERTFPRGLDTEAFFADVLFRMDRMARSVPAREHVTYHLVRERPDLFVTRSIRGEEDNSDLRWTVDTAADLETVRRIYLEAGLETRRLPYPELVRWVRARPDIATSNLHIEQKKV